MESNIWTYIGGFIFLATVVYFLREVLIIDKKNSRKSELEHHVMMIRNPYGSSSLRKRLLFGSGSAMDHFKRARHIVEHYGVQLSEVGFKGDLNDLELAARKMQKHYKRRIHLGKVLLKNRISASH